MRSFVSIACLFLLTGQLAAQTATFEGLNYHTTTPNYENGSHLTGSFTSGGSTFNNYYNTQYNYWSGFSYSQVTNVTTNTIGNQYAAYSFPGGFSNLPNGSGDDSAGYAVAYNSYVGDARIDLPTGTRPGTVSITNSTYTALAVRDGDPYGFSRAFENGDWFKLTIHGRNALNQTTGSAEIYLADYRNGGTFIRDQWTTLNLSTLGNDTTHLLFELESTDVGFFGMNTPAYFAMDNLVVTPVPEPISVGCIAMLTYLGFRRRNKPLKNRDNQPNR